VLADHVRQAITRSGVPGAGLLDVTVHLREALAVAGVEDRFLVGEVVVQGGLADAEQLGDVPEGGGVVPVLAERPQRGREDLLPPAPALLADVLRAGNGARSRHGISERVARN
jgi:hypothetical protein